MNDWIELNLPFSYNENIKFPKYPDLDKRWKKLFKITPEEKLGLLLESGAFYKFNELAAKLEEKLSKKLSKDDLLSDDKLDELDKQLYKLIGKSKDKDILAVLNYKILKREYDDWFDKQPEVKKWKDKVEKLTNEHDEKIKTMSFCGLGLNKPGVLIKVECDDGIHEYLIGDINCNRGVCDDCVAFEKNAIVKSYKILWNKD